MAKVKQIGTNNIIDVADPTFYTESGKYQLYNNTPTEQDLAKQAGIDTNVSGWMDRYKQGLASPVGINDSTESLRKQENSNKLEAYNFLSGLDEVDNLQRQALANLLGSNTYQQTAEGQIQQQELDQLRSNLGIITPQEEEQISAEAQMAESQFSPLIAEAEAQRESGLPKALIGAGRRGGLMNTQFAGAAALAPTEGGDFFGAGGELERIKSVYDRNISNLQIQQRNAGIAAKAAARKAIETGKREDYDLAKDAYNEALQAHNDAIKLAQERLNVINNYQNSLSARETSKFSQGVQLFDLANQITEGQTVNIPGIGQVTGLAQPSVDTQAFTDNQGNVTIIDKNSGAILGSIPGIGPEKAANLQLHTVGRSVFMFDPDSGQLIDTGIVKPDESMEEILTPAELKSLNAGLPAGEQLPYGTTRRQAMESGAIPAETPETRTFVDSTGNFIEIGSKQLSPSQTQLLSEGKQLSDVLDPLYSIVKDQQSLFGPIKGFLGQRNPYNEKAQTVDDDLRRASQVIGRYMEGGVLRKEDEEKYRKMLPQLTDTPEVAQNKLDGVADLLQKKQQQYLEDFGRAGYDVSNFIEGGELKDDPLNIGSQNQNDPLGVGFNQPGTEANAGAEVEKISQAIGQYESGGNYKARGPVVTSGQYKGERALGKYQIMPGNLPSWSKAALGRDVSEEEFLNNPQIQDKIAQYKINEIYQKYGNIEDVASVWFSGRPLAKAGNAQDVLGTSVPSYVKNISSIYNRLT